MATSNIRFQQRTEASIQNLQTQIGQLATIVSELKSQGSGQLSSQTVSNPRSNVSNPGDYGDFQKSGSKHSTS